MVSIVMKPLIQDYNSSFGCFSNTFEGENVFSKLTFS